MKIYTITYHRCYNFGATLQAYALMKYLRNQGCDAQIVDYFPKRMWFRNRFFALGGERSKKNIFTKFVYLILQFPSRLSQLLRKKAFDKFEKKYFELTNKITNYPDLSTKLGQADFYICGSDQIWNPHVAINNNDPAFYLEFVSENKKKIAFAASFGVDKLSDNDIHIIKPMINNFSKIFVREKSGLSILADMGVNNAQTVADPVFLLSKDDWNKFTYNINEKYILVYALSDYKKAINIAKAIADKTKLKIFNISLNKIKGADKDLTSVGPFDFLSYIKKCEYFVTDSFHGTAFSLIFNKNFILFKRNGINMSSRLINLLDEFKIENRFINDDFQLFDLLKPIDYLNINNHLNDYANDARNKLLNAINN